MKFEVGKFYKTRNGLKAEIRLNDVKAVSGEHLLVRIKDEDWLMYPDGKFYNNHNSTHDYDLISEWKEPIKIDGWVNIFSDALPSRTLYSTKEVAERVGQNIQGYITTIFVSGEQELD